MNAHINYDLPQAILAVVTDEEFGDPSLLARRRRDHERIDAILAGRVAAEDVHISSRSAVRPIDRALRPANRWASKRFLREARDKVWTNAIELWRARAIGVDDYRARLAELEVLSASKVSDLLTPGPVLLRLAVAGFGVTLPLGVDRRAPRLRDDPRLPEQDGSAHPRTGPTTVSVPLPTMSGMVFVNAGTLGTVPGARDDLVALLTRRNEQLAHLGCLAYEVGVNDERPDTVFVVELWDSAESHRSSLSHPDVQASISRARPLLSGEFGGFRFDVVGSPLRD